MVNRFKSLFSFQIDMTEGNLFKKIGLFALPLFLATVLQLLYSTVDLITVHFLGGGENSMAAVAANSSLINLVIVVFSNISLGANVSVGNAKGAGDQAKAERVLHTALIFSLISGILVGVIGFFESRRLLELMGTSSYLIDLATTYLKIYFLGAPFIMVYNYLSQIMRSIGDSTTPFIILFISGLFNVVADIIFVTSFNMDVAGVAWATILSEFISAVLTIMVFTFKKNSYVNLHWSELRISKDAMADILKIGLPAGLQGFFFALPNVFIQAKLYQIDPSNNDLQNGAIASSNVEGYIYAGIEALTSACMSFTATNYGAKKKGNIKKVLYYSIIWILIYCAVVSILILTCHRYILSLYVNQEVALEAGRQRLFMVGLTYVLDGFMDIFSGSLRGCRRSVIPMVITLLCCTVLRIVLLETAFNIPYFHTVMWLYSVFPISWTLATIADAIAWSVCWKGVKAHCEEQAHLEA